MDKREMIADLYALRAGLSYIALEGQKMESERNAARDLCNREVADANGEYQSTQEQIKILQNQVGDVEQDRAKYIESKRREMDEVDEKIEYIKNGYDVRDAYDDIQRSSNKVNKKNAKIRYKQLVNQHKTGEIDNTIKALVSRKEYMEKTLYGESLPRFDEKIKSIHSRIKLMSENSFAIQNVTNARIVKAREKYEVSYNNAEKHIENATIVYNALVENYSAMLDPRDWKNLDVIIYNFETNRADTIKEALLIVDTEQRNNALIVAINGAANAICNTIRDEMAYTRSSISASITMLSGRISSYADKVSELGKAVNSQTESLSAINSGINKIVDQTALCSALTEKANATSYELVDNVKKLVKIAERI